MALKLNNITFKKGQGGSGRLAPGEDYISGLMFFNDNRPAALLASLPGGVDNYPTGSVVEILSPADAVALGIDDTYSDETRATGTITISNVGSNGDTLKAYFQEWTGGSGNGSVLLGTYTKTSSISNVTQAATALAADINANTNLHGYTATSALGVVTITARKGLGVYPNSGTPYSVVLTGGVAASITQNVVAGVASEYVVYYYHIVRYFTQKPDGKLFVGIFDVAGASGSSSFTDIEYVMRHSDNTLVQLGIWDSTQTYALSTLTRIQAVVVGMENKRRYLSSVVYAADIKAIGAIATLAGTAYNLQSLTAYKVSSLIDNDANGFGFDLYNQQGKSITSLGACIGCISEAAVSEDIGNPIDRFNTNDGYEFDTLMFGDGTLYAAVPDNTLDNLNGNRYIFLSKIPQTFGSFYSDNHTACSVSNDYAFINDNRVIDKVIKQSFRQIVPFLKAKLALNTDGTMKATTIQAIQGALNLPIRAMIAATDLAGDADAYNPNDWITIPANQKPNLTQKLVVNIKLKSQAIAREIEIPIGYNI